MIDNAIAIICSRPESKRLPGKVFKRIAGYPALEHILKRIIPDIETVLAIPDDLELHNPDFNAYDRLVCYYKTDFFIGNSLSPLHRMANFFTTRMDKHKWLVRITHDDILIDSRTMLDLIAECEKQDAGYGISPGIVEGAGVEIIRRENLLAAAERHKKPTEFVSYFVQGEGLPFPKVVKIKSRESIRRSYRLTMDYPEDAQVLDIVLKQVGAFASTDDVCRFIDQNPFVMNLNRQPELTIYTCAYNAEKYLQKTIESVLALQNLNFEYLLIDDGSTDKTPLIMSKFANDKRVKIILNEKNIGLASSSNVALDNAKGKYIMRVDADDILLGDRFLEMYDKMRQSNYAVMYPCYQENYFHGPSHEVFLPNVHHHAGCALMDKRVLNEIRFRDDLRHWDSLELYKRLSDRASVGYFGATTFYYRKHKDSMSNSNTQERKKTLEEIANAGK